MRGSLHANILTVLGHNIARRVIGACIARAGRLVHMTVTRCWFEKRRLPEGYVKLGVVPRRIPGTDNRQRPQSQKVAAPDIYREDNVYRVAKVGRVVAEMVGG